MPAIKVAFPEEGANGAQISGGQDPACIPETGRGRDAVLAVSKIALTLAGN
jgi:hypothetical protein